MPQDGSNQKPNEPDFSEFLPLELTLQILSYLNINSLLASSLVNQKLYQASSSHTLWNQLGYANKKAAINLASSCARILKKNPIQIALVGDKNAKDKKTNFIDTVFSYKPLPNPYSMNIESNNYAIKLWRSKSQENDDSLIQGKQSEIDVFILACDNNENAHSWIKKILHGRNHIRQIIFLLDMIKLDNLPYPCLALQSQNESGKNAQIDFFNCLIQAVETHAVPAIEISQNTLLGEAIVNKKSFRCLTM